MGFGGRIGRLTVVVAMVVVTAACSHPANSQGQGSPQVQGGPNTFLVKAESQKSDGKFLVIDQAILKGVQGYVAIHANGGGAPGPTIGVSALLPPGVSNQIKVAIEPPLTTSGSVFAMLHVEDDHNTTFDFPHGDAPATLDGRVVVVPIQVTVSK